MCKFVAKLEALKKRFHPLCGKSRHPNLSAEI